MKLSELRWPSTLRPQFAVNEPVEAAGPVPARAGTAGTAAIGEVVGRDRALVGGVGGVGRLPRTGTADRGHHQGEGDQGGDPDEGVADGATASGPGWSRARRRTSRAGPAAAGRTDAAGRTGAAGRA